MAIRINTISQFTKEFYDEFAPFYNEWRKLKDSRLIIKLWCKQKSIELLDCELPKKSIGKVGGTTNGRYIAVDFDPECHALNFFLFWHEYAHYHLHFTKSGSRLSHKSKEQEADAFACYICTILFPGNYENFLKFAIDNPTTDLTRSQRVATFLQNYLE